VIKTSFYKWRQRYSSMDVSQLKELKALQEENRRLKHLFADLSLDHSLLKEIVEKNSKVITA